MIARHFSPIADAATTMQLILYQRDDCHLCDLALLELALAAVPDFDSVFIDDEPALEQRYGARVPVLVAMQPDQSPQRELEWPFDAAGVRAWLFADG